MYLSKKLACLVAILFTFVASAGFAADCSEAELQKIGPNAAVEGQTVVQIQCLSDKATWGNSDGIVTLVVHPDITDQTLATALTAMSLGKNVWVRASGTTTSSMITVMYLNK